jgi:hydroxymethylglutaryl-CoA reductase (NADPH)
MSLRHEGGPRVELVPRLEGQGYSPELIAERRRWLEAKTGAALPHVGQFSQPGEELRGNIENAIGMAQVPLGIAGPMLVDGEDARGVFYVPMATSEGALVRSYERGMVALTHAGGVTVRVHGDRNRISPSFFFAHLTAAHEFLAWIEAQAPEIRARAEATTRHGRLLGLRCHPVGRQVVVDFDYSTADASGMNMMTTATDAACRWIVEASRAEGYHLFSGAESEKHAGAALMAGGKGKHVSAGALLPDGVLRAVLHAGAADFARLWRGTMTGHLLAGGPGYNGQLANGLAAMFIAFGQDVANVTNAAVGITRFEEAGEGSLYASVTLPALTVATVGGGTALATAAECLSMVGCRGPGRARKLAEIMAATLLAGELSMGGAIASGEHAAAHQELGRNRPRTGP